MAPLNKTVRYVIQACRVAQQELGRIVREIVVEARIRCILRLTTVRFAELRQVPDVRNRTLISRKYVRFRCACDGAMENCSRIDISKSTCVRGCHLNNPKNPTVFVLYLHRM